jgi:ribosomal protein S12 methylthiotransferase
MRSRTVPSLVAEARGLVEGGVVEIGLVGQDTTAYGRDLAGGGDLGALVRALCRVDGLEWVRVHYAYPHGVPSSLLTAMAQEEKVCRYLDIPLQHASGRMLRAMRRGVSRSGQERILARLRAEVPGIALRSTFIVGFPGETDGDFDELLDFLREQRFDRVGAFPYYREDGTPAAALPGQLPDDVKEARLTRLLEVQGEVSRARLRGLVGLTLPVVVDGPDADEPLVTVGRLATQAPEVDGHVYLDGAPPDLRPGGIRPVRITRSTDYDLVGRIAA